MGSQRAGRDQVTNTFFTFHNVNIFSTVLATCMKCLVPVFPDMLRCFSSSKLRKLWYIYTMEYYSAIKKNTFESVLMRWMKLEPIIQSEVSQKDKGKDTVLVYTNTVY